MDDAVSITLGATTLGLLVKEALAWWRERHQKTEIAPQPLDVRKAPDYVTCEQCELRHKDVEKRLDAGTRAFEAIRTKMDADHRDVIQGINKLNDRVAPVAEACAANSQAIRILLKEPTK